MDPIGDNHFNGSQDNGPLSGDHWENELMGAKTTTGMYVCVCVFAYTHVCMCMPMCMSCYMCNNITLINPF